MKDNILDALFNGADLVASLTETHANNVAEAREEGIKLGLSRIGALKLVNALHDRVEELEDLFHELYEVLDDATDGLDALEATDFDSCRINGHRDFYVAGADSILDLVHETLFDNE